MFLLKINFNWMFTKVFPIYPSLVCHYFALSRTHFVNVGFLRALSSQKYYRNVHQAAIYSTAQTVLKSITNRLGSSIVIRFFAWRITAHTEHRTQKLKLKSEIFLAMWITSLYKRKDAKVLTLTCKDTKKIFISTRGLCITIILLPKKPQRHLSE